MHQTPALHTLEHVAYSAVRKLICTRYEANERAPISVQTPENSYKNSQLSHLSVMTSPGLAHQNCFLILIHHLEVQHLPSFG